MRKGIWSIKSQKNMIRRINVYGAPGSGKSTKTAEFFSLLKKKHHNIELVTEYIKEWTYLGRIPRSFDQWFVTMMQLHKEDYVLNGGVESIITDCPIYLCCFYTYYYGIDGYNNLVSLCEKFEETYPSLNIFIRKDISEHNNIGRYQNYDESIEIEKQLDDFLFYRFNNMYHNIIFHKTSDNIEEIFKNVTNGNIYNK